MSLVFRREDNFGSVPFGVMPAIWPCMGEEALEVVVSRCLITHQLTVGPNAYMWEIEGIVYRFCIPGVDSNQIAVNNG
jgi:hypothetical protein